MQEATARKHLDVCGQHQLHVAGERLKCDWAKRRCAGRVQYTLDSGYLVEKKVKPLIIILILVAC